MTIHQLKILLLTESDDPSQNASKTKGRTFLRDLVVTNVIFGGVYMKAQALDYICSHICNKYTFSCWFINVMRALIHLIINLVNFFPEFSKAFCFLA